MPSKYIAPLLPAVALVLIVALFLWEFSAGLFRTLILGQSAEEQMRDLNTRDE